MSVPPSVLAQYQSVNAAADQTAQTPFQTYGSELVAPVNTEQSQGITGTNTAATQAQPYISAGIGQLASAQADTAPINQMATGLAAGSSTLNGSSVNNFLSPYLNDVLGSTEALQNQSNQQAQAGQLGNAITSGAFGGDRTGIAAANLQQQLNLSNSNTIANIANQGFNTALGAAQTEQGIGLQGAQTLAGIGQTAYGEGANTASETAGLGSAAQTAALQGSQAQIAAGTVQQQTQQAQDTAQYQQFLQEQSYPFQVDQFLANIAEGTGSLSGSTTTTQQPGGFFSDRRLKHDIKKIGETYDGQTLYSYKMHGDDRTHIGLIAQDVEKKHPQAVGVAGGFKMVDYGKATEKAANRGHFYSGGVVPIRRVARAGGGGLDDVLQAQQQMYAGLGGGQRQREIAQGNGGSHQLAVASGPTGQAPNGASQVQQGIGLGKDAYKAYKYFKTPSTGGGLAPASSAGAPISGSAADTGNLGVGLDTSVNAGAPGAGLDMSASAGATDAAAAAAPSAAEAASSTAAGSAAGAATSAAAGAATDAAAEEAAALAAEYAAADIGVAALAAKRGGRIHRDLGGGTPYASDQDLAIPDDPNQYTLQKAGPITKQKTGLQTLMYMGDPNNASSLTGSMFSDSALAQGGVAGRRGYDDGGAPDDDSAPEPSADDAGTAPVAQADDQPVASGLGAAAPKKSLWDHIKDTGITKPENFLPVLSGLAAMGTAKTRSPGVALAAGLGAGADEYLSSRASLAKTAEEQAVAQGQQNQNAVSAVRARAANDFYPPGGAPTATAAPISPVATPIAAPTDAPPANPAAALAANIDQSYRKKYAVNPAYTADEQAAWNKGNAQASLLNIDGPLKQAIQTHDNRVAQQQFQNRNAAQAEADTLYAQATDPNADYATAQAAIAKYNAVHQWTGDDYNTVGGNKNNSRNGAPAIGIAAAQLGPDQLASLMDRSQALVEKPNTDGTVTQMPNWKAHNAPSAEAYARQLSGFANSGGSSAPSVSASATPQGSAVVPARPPRAAAVAPPVAGPSPAIQQSDPYLSKALADPTWSIPIEPTVSGTTQNPQSLHRQNIARDSAAALNKNYDEATKAAATSNQFLGAAKDILDSKGATMGKYGGLIANASAYLPFDQKDATNYQKVSKYLVNAAVQAGKVSFPNPTQSEVGMSTNEMNPNPKMTDDTLSDLVSTGIRANNFVIDSGKRVQQFLGSGDVPKNDPDSFDKWNQKWYPRDKLINAKASATGKNGEKIYFVNGKWTQ